MNEITSNRCFLKQVLVTPHRQCPNAARWNIGYGDSLFNNEATCLGVRECPELRLSTQVWLATRGAHHRLAIMVKAARHLKNN